MSSTASFPWKQIDDFVVEAGSVRDESAFLDFVSARIADLVPSDLPPAFMRVDERSGIHRCLRSWDARTTRLYNDRLRNRPPFGVDFIRTHHVVDFSDFRESEYYQRLFRPNKIRWVLGTLVSVYACLTRADGSPPFSKREIKVYDILSRHLSNLASLYGKLSRMPAMEIGRAELARDCRILSKREAEIARLLALRMTSREIASFLYVSPRTVERHVANAYEKLGVSCRADLLAKVFGDDAPAASDM